MSIPVVKLKRLLLLISFILIMAFVGLCVWLRDQYVVPILMYHSISSADMKPVFVIGHPSKLKFRLINVSPRSFEAQMGFLKNNGYHVIPLDDFIEGNSLGKKFPHKTVVITFDDGYLDNYTNAFPVLKKYHFPATIFLISGLVDKNPGLLTWDLVKEMGRNGITFGSHTRHHVYLPQLSEEQMKDEIIGSKQEIEIHLGNPISSLAYPTGGFNEQIKAIAALAGYKAALTTNRGHSRHSIDPYELRRIHINNWDNGTILGVKVSGYYNLFRMLKPGDEKSG